MPPRSSRERDGGEVSSRPPTVKADDLRSMEALDEEDGGWAGHHEEVDYTKVQCTSRTVPFTRVSSLVSCLEVCADTSLVTVCDEPLTLVVGDMCA